MNSACRNIWVVAKREFTDYFTSPVASKITVGPVRSDPIVVALTSRLRSTTAKASTKAKVDTAMKATVAASCCD